MDLPPPLVVRLGIALKHSISMHGVWSHNRKAFGACSVANDRIDSSTFSRLVLLWDAHEIHLEAQHSQAGDIWKEQAHLTVIHMLGLQGRLTQM